jgi:hypothetical protein
MGEKLLTERISRTDRLALLFSILYWGVALIFGIGFGIYMLYYVIEVPETPIVERIALTIFATIALFFGWAIPLFAHKNIDTGYLKTYTARFLLITIALYLIARLVFRYYHL